MLSDHVVQKTNHMARGGEIAGGGGCAAGVWWVFVVGVWWVCVAGV